MEESLQGNTVTSPVSMRWMHCRLGSLFAEIQWRLRMEGFVRANLLEVGGKENGGPIRISS